MKLGCYELDTIVQGNAHELIKQVPTASVDCVYTDPPYLFQQGGGSGSSPLALRVKKHKAELESNGIWSGFDYSIFAEFVRVMRNINCFIWCSKEQVYPILDWWCKNTNATYQILTWNKTNPAPMCNGNWLSDIEYCLYFNRGTKLNDGIEHKSKWYTSAINVKDKGKWGHLTIKPLELVERHLRHTTMGGGVLSSTRLQGAAPPPLLAKISADTFSVLKSANGGTK